MRRRQPKYDSIGQLRHRADVLSRHNISNAGTNFKSTVTYRVELEGVACRLEDKSGVKYYEQLNMEAGSTRTHCCVMRDGVAEAGAITAKSFLRIRGRLFRVLSVRDIEERGRFSIIDLSEIMGQGEDVLNANRSEDTVHGSTQRSPLQRRVRI